RGGGRGAAGAARGGAAAAPGGPRAPAGGPPPPVLTDRGLEAAVGSLADHNPLPIDVSVELDERPPSAVETAAYFVVAEALTNATKHARATRVSISIRAENGSVVVDVEDDGDGGADGLGGLARRVRALDGTLEVRSPAGGPTKLTAELPCAS